MRHTRRLISILLLAVFSLPLVLPLVAMGQDSESGLPACCRRNGKHHCSMGTADRSRASAQQAHLQSPVEQCPFCPAFMVTPHGNDAAALPAHTAFALLFHYSSGLAQTESKWRIARDRSRQKRGPPTA